MDRDGRVVHAFQEGVTSDHIEGGAASTDDLRVTMNHFPPGGDAGHIRANCLGGDNELINFIPQIAANNQGIQCTLEMAVSKMLKDGRCRVHIHLHFRYNAAANPGAPVELGHYRPNSIRYQVTRGGQCAAAGWTIVPANGDTVFDITYPN